MASESAALCCVNVATFLKKEQKKSRANALEAILNDMTAVIHDFTCATTKELGWGYLDAVMVQ